MEKDTRLYDMISHLATGESAQAADLFKTMLDERITAGIETLSKTTQITPNKE